tara:strand:- start:3056 stop:3628 length:573 start_codon:yes stop_codon:yes gene_type:complete
MNILSNFEKFVEKFFGGKDFGPMAFLLTILLLALIGNYSSGFANIFDPMGQRLHKGEAAVGKGFVASPSDVQPARPLGENSDFASVTGMKGTTCNTPDCNKKDSVDPSSLLPNDSNSAWASLNPVGQGSLANVNLLDSGYHIGQQAQVNRNPNLQIRSEPANPRGNVGPWQQTTIEPDSSRKTLEIGASA